MQKDFDHPFIVGLVGDKLERHLKLRNRFESELKKTGLKNVIYLLLRTQPKDLKNLITCMKLMDVIAVNLIEKYEKPALRLVDQLHTSAKAAKRVNLIVKKRDKFIGYFVKNIVRGSIELVKPTMLMNM